jgi:hypothetical protein
VLGGCDPKISHEHLVSESILDLFEGISVQGFKWCKEEPRVIGVGSLTAKNLCKNHNSDLSPTDHAALAFFRAVKDEINETPESRASRINSNFFERWLLKTAINLGFQGPSGTPWQGLDVPARLVKMAFGRRNFRKPFGFYVHASPRRIIDGSNDFLQFTPYYSQDNSLRAFMYLFRGVAVLLWVHDEPMRARDVLGGLPASEFLCRPKTLNIEAGRHRRHVEFV